MFICYFDETGDDGFPERSSDLFVLTSVYTHYQNWKENFLKIKEFRTQLKKDYNFPVKLEFHTKNFLTDKNPYRELNLSYEQRKEIIFLFFNLVSILDINIINVVIDKNNITTKDYDVLENALKYNIQRIENDLKQKGSDNKFLIITDEGRLSKMVRVAREIQKINFIPSKYNPAGYRCEIEKMIEDPLPKKSDESYFIQISDMISYIVFLYSQRKFVDNTKWANRVTNILSYGDEINLLDKIKNVLNLKASLNDYGIVYYPKKNTT
ncbi:DUF3800 domain-containing protein [Candidatus Gracilibacteria bacterium]|nr:DUF3800 domain-containing protein [Candidatus Gracilibacteria bacterium]